MKRKAVGIRNDEFASGQGLIPCISGDRSRVRTSIEGVEMIAHRQRKQVIFITCTPATIPGILIPERYL